MSINYKKFEPDSESTSKTKGRKYGFLIASIVFSILFLIVLILVFYWRKPEQEWSNEEGLVKSFDGYIEKFGKGYKKDSEEYTVRLAYFRDSVKEIDRLNRESQGPEHLRARYGPTKFSDLSKDEFAKRFLSGLAPTDRTDDAEELGSVELSNIHPGEPENERGEAELEKDWQQEHDWSIEEELLVKSFDEYIENFEKGYKKYSKEYEVRLGHFKESLKEIDRLNRASHGPRHLRARYGLTKFSDLHKEEFAKMFLSGLTPTNQVSGASKAVEEWDGIKEDYLPKEKDWRTEGAVGPIEDQGACGGCWAFSTVGVIESFVAIHLNQARPKLSIQQVLDCVEGRNAKCSGGDPAYTMKLMYRYDFVMVPESEYPLNFRNETCKGMKTDGYILTMAINDSYVDKEIEMKRLLATHGPIAVNVNAYTWQNYVSGTIQNNCGGDNPSELNHAVQLVGYNETAEVPYYIVRNSWGSTWNDLAGYVHLAMYRNECGLAFRVATPTAVCRTDAATKCPP